ncbi:MAG: ribosomal protection-like ABC-F family protein [Bacteroidia bacterium]
MNYISVENISKAYGDKQLFDNISFGISRGDKIALVAKNGTGKTTLMSILKGKEIPDKGKVSFRKEINIGFLDQEPVFDENMTVIDTLLSAKNKMTDAIKKYNTIMSSENQEGLDDVLMMMNDLNAWEYESKVEEILSRLQITQLQQPIKTLSGGQRKRVALARVILDRPDIMVLDEPTNHLDVEMIEWLENYLSAGDFTILLVTHDRYFLDSVCNTIFEIDNKQLFTYKGNFEYFLEKKAERVAATASEIEKDRNIYRRELEWVRKSPRARGTKAKARVDAFDEIAERAAKKKEDAKVEMSVKMNRMGSKILEIVHISKAYGEKKLINDFTYTFKRSEKIGITGANGSGKTTLLNIIQGIEQPDSGRVQTGETIIYGYYSQRGLQLKNDKRVLETITDIAEFIPLADGSTLSASKLLSRFNFSPSVQYQYVSTLSGGERRRLYLLTVLIKNPNFLILDEPTNDLDIVTLQTLEDFLLDFKGCVIIVSHDRYFMDKMIDHLLIFEGNGEIRDFPGNYTEYRDWKISQKSKKSADSKQLTASKEQPVVEAKQPEVKKDAKKTSFKVLHEIEELEKDIAQLEAKRKELEAKLSSGITDHVELQKLGEELAATIKLNDEKSTRWLELQE